MQARKRRYKILRWVVFLCIVLFSVSETVVIGIGNQRKDVTLTITAVSYGMLTLLLIVIGVMMIVGLRKFIRIVSRMKPGSNDLLNRKFIYMQLIALFVWMLIWIFDGLFWTLHYANYQSFGPLRSVLIVDGISFMMTFFNFLIIARVIYRSSKFVPRSSTTSSAYD